MKLKANISMQITVGKESQTGSITNKIIAVVSIVQTVFNLNRTGYILLKTGKKVRTVGLLVII